jgi:membrane fusion protein (multidrug efflux system)
MKRIIIGIIALGIAAVVIVRVIQASAPAEPTSDVDEIRRQTGVPVEVMQITPGPLEARRVFTGAVRGVRGATVRARTGDEILEIPVRVGQRVAEGEVVVRQSSQGSMASVRQAEAAFEQARRAVDRLRPLHEQGAVSDQDWDNALTGLRVAEANLDAARRSIVLTSPITGVVTDVLVTPGTFPGNGDPLVDISDLSQLQVLLQVSPDQKSELSVGQTAHMAGGSVQGRVTRIAMQADPESRLVEVEVTFPGGAWAQDAGTLPGTLATLEIVVGSRESALQVPLDALHDGSVWVVDEQGLAHPRPVRTGLRSRDRVEVVEGLRIGERVVTAGASLLSDGVPTRIVGG